MSDPSRPYGADTLVIPFTWIDRRPAAPPEEPAPENPPPGEAPAEDS